MGSATKGQLMKTATAHPLGHIALPRASGTVRAHLASPYPWVGGWIRIPICRIPIWPFCRRSSSFQPAQSMNVLSPQMFSSPQKRKCLEGQRGTLNIVCQSITKCHRHSASWQGSAKGYTVWLQGITRTFKAPLLISCKRRWSGCNSSSDAMQADARTKQIRTHAPPPQTAVGKPQSPQLKNANNST